jgi:hypothetical protein
MGDKDVALSDWPLNDSQLVTAVILGIMLIVLIVTAFRKPRVTRKEFARLQENVKRLSEDVKELRLPEDGCFIKELDASKSRQRKISVPERELEELIRLLIDGDVQDNRPSQLVSHLQH